MKRALRSRLKMLTQHVLLPLVYNLNRRRKIDPDLVVFADAHHTSCPPQMEHLADRMKQEGCRVRGFFFDTEKIGTLSALRRSAAFMKLYATAGCVVICDNFLPVAACRKKKDTKVIQLWHGCGAFKKFGYDTEDDIPADYKGNVYKNYDLVAVSAKACVPYFASAMRQADGVVDAIGIPCTDRLYSEAYANSCREAFYSAHPEAVGKRIVLWAPSFRGNAQTAKTQAEGLLPGEAAVDRLREDAGIFLVKSYHPHMKKDGAMNTSELLAVADVLITDYSSVFFEYLLLDRPVIFFVPDLYEYRDKRGWYLSYEELPGQIVTSENELAGCVKEAILQDACVAERDVFRKRYMSACDGHATDRVADYIRTAMEN